MNFLAYIVEDNSFDYEELTKILNSLPNVKIISSYKAGHLFNDSILNIGIHQPNLLIIDEDLKDPAGTGFDLFNKVDNVFRYTIFYSRYPERAAKNPLSHPNATFVFKNYAQEQGMEGLKEDFKKALIGAETYFKRIYHIQKIQWGTDHNFINSSDIVFLQSKGNYTLIHLKNKNTSIQVRGGISKFFEKYNLAEMGFVKVDRSFIVNKYEVSAVIGSYVFVNHLPGKPTKIPLSRRSGKDAHVKLLREKFQK